MPCSVTWVFSIYTTSSWDNCSRCFNPASGELRSAVGLPKKTVDDLLKALAQAWQIAVVERAGRRFYISR